MFSGCSAGHQGSELGLESRALLNYNSNNSDKELSLAIIKYTFQIHNKH